MELYRNRLVRPTQRPAPGLRWSPRWVHMRSGREKDNDRLSERIMLYALAYQETHGQEGDIVIQYTATGSTRGATPQKKVLENHTKTIDILLAGIAAGAWAPKVGVSTPSEQNLALSTFFTNSSPIFRIGMRSHF
jgi:hypothetical protein